MKMKYRKAGPESRTIPQKRISLAWITGKAVAALLMLVYLLAFGGTILKQTREAAQKQDLADEVRICDGYYYEKNYADLYAELKCCSGLLREADGSAAVFDRYQEITEGYRDYISFLQWSRTPGEQVPGSSEQAAFYRQKAAAHAATCRNPQNREQLEAWKQRTER